jgi:N-methylhydantoinase A/oxoprolinase/acetone carboxylase beta subunit
MPILLGIDTGGTYTDAVLLDEEKGILAAAKAPTTHDDLAIGIRNAIQNIFEHTKPHIHLVSLSSTLATNAVVENKGRSAGLILIGYDSDSLDTDIFKKIRSENPVVCIRGGHRISGNEQTPLDKKGLQEAVKSLSHSVSAFAVSGFFSVRNPSHELAAKAMIREMTGLPVTCGHELTTNLDAPRRAITTLLNARLIPLIHELIHSVEKVLIDFNIHAPLMIVKGDGSLISAKAALDVPIETILSGPAASVVGALYLTGLNEALVIDMGGTTSDMAVIKSGSTKITMEGTFVGDFQPMVKSMNVLTKGIGGDGWIRADKQGKLRVGPMRVLPICVLGHRYPVILKAMQNFKVTINNMDLPLFVLKQKSITAPKGLASSCCEILERVNDNPLFVPQALATLKYPSVYAQSIHYLIKEGLVGACSVTPTDAVNVLGLYRIGSSEAARMGVEFIAAGIGMNGEEFCKMAVAQVQYELASAMIQCALGNEGENFLNQSVDSFFIHRALKKTSDHLVNCCLSLSCPIVGVGAPSGTYLPQAASLLGCELYVPGNGAVANAIGAVTGVVSQAAHILIKPIHGGSSFRVHAPEGISGFESYKDAENYAVATAANIAENKAKASGAETVEIHVVKNRMGAINGKFREKSEILVETEIIAMAVGRPRMGA